MERRLLLADVSGGLVEWQPLAVTFAGPASSELSSAPNPFLDCRLNVTFTHLDSGRQYDVPGFFAGDGAGGGTGDRWRANFTPDDPGQWSYRASFRVGSGVAVDLDPAAGVGVGFDGEQGAFTVAPADPNAPGFLKWGRLEYVGGHHYKFRDGPYWLKTGADSPENFFGYSGFDNTPGARHDYDAHVADWQPGDPDWGGGRGRGIVGAVNYLADHGVNSIYFMPMNIGGDAQDTWPFVGPISAGGNAANDNLHYDISKLEQWDVVFAHAQRRGVQLHFVLNEAEADNKTELDGGTLGIERKLYYRELVARFGHHNGVQWNVSEEYEYKHPFSPQQVKDFAGYIEAVDPYDHPVTVHNQANPDTTWAPFVGDERFSATSFQYSGSVGGHGDEVEEWRARTAAAGRPIPIFLDEMRSTTTSNEDPQRVELLWPTLMSGGGGLEYYMGGVDTTLDNFRAYEDLWNWTGHARRFFEQHLPFWEMTPADGLLTGESSNDGGGQVFAKSGDVYAVYIPVATNTGTLDLTGTPGQAFEQRWFNPRTGRFEGAAREVTGGAPVALGPAPGTTSEDWVALLRRTSGSPGPTLTPLPPPSPTPKEIPLPEPILVPSPTPTTTPTPTPTPTPSPAGGPTVTRLVLVDADQDRDLLTLADGQQIDLATLPTANLNVRADVGSGVDAVVFALDAADPYSIEQSAPYALAGDRGGDYREWTPSEGGHTISATAVDGNNQPGPTLRLGFTVVRGGNNQVASPATTPFPAPPRVTGLTLIDAVTERPIGVLQDGAVIDRGAVGASQFNVRAEVAGGVRSVRFEFAGGDVRVENDAPFSLFGDRAGDYRAWAATPGVYTLTAIAFGAVGARGTSGASLTVTFRII